MVYALNALIMSHPHQANAFNSTANLSQDKPTYRSGVTEDATDTSDASARLSLNISFDDTSDAECTVITIEGQDQSHLLMSLTSIFITSGLNVVTASITSEDGRINDVFRVQTPEGGKVGGNNVVEQTAIWCCLSGRLVKGIEH